MYDIYAIDYFAFYGSKGEHHKARVVRLSLKFTITLLCEDQIAVLSSDSL